MGEYVKVAEITDIAPDTGILVQLEEKRIALPSYPTVPRL